IQGRQRGRAAYPQPAGVRWYEPREFAPGAAPRGLVTANTPAHRQATAGMRPFVLLPDLHQAVAYDWQLGGPVQRSAEATDDQRAANYARGYAPGSDQALAAVLAALDQAPDQRQLANYFEHLYADRNGAVFAGVSLYDAWRAGRTLEMPDTDTIAFAKLCLGTAAFTAPLPGDRRRERLYRKMATGFAQHHEHRTLVQALAATFVCAEPGLDPAWQSLVDRGHWLWQQHGRNPEALAKWLATRTARADVLAEVDAARKADDSPGRQHREALAAMAAWLRQCLDRELRAAGV
ncbi:MAG: hypothetical protein WAT39_25160, partial [Planctomycetota bacterium]